MDDWVTIAEWGYSSTDDEDETGEDGEHSIDSLTTSSYNPPEMIILLQSKLHNYLGQKNIANIDFAKAIK